MPHWLCDRFAEFGDRTAIVCRSRRCTYAELLAGAQAWVERLEEHDLSPGDCVALAGEYSPNACALLLALILQKNIAVPLGPRPRETTEAMLELACVRGVFRFAEDDSWQLERRLADDQPLLAELRARGEPGLVLFTSGSTGAAKASLLSFARLLEKHRERRRAFRTLIFMQMDHIGGLNTLFHVLTEGGTLVSLDERTPEAVCRAIEQERIQLLPTTPTFLNMLLISQAHLRYDLSSLELITYGTEPMPQGTLKNLHRALPHVRLKQTYGLSELGILPTRSREPDSLWVKVGGQGFETRVVDGVLWIRSPSEMLGYLNAPSPFDADGWFNTGDAVEVDGDCLRILGRKSELINVGGEKVSPIEVESVLLEMARVTDATVWGKKNAVTGQVVVARVVLGEEEERDAFEERMRVFCQGRLKDYQVPVFVEIASAQQPNDRFKKVRLAAAGGTPAPQAAAPLRTPN